MPVDALYIPAECLPLELVRSDRLDIGDEAIDLPLVVIQKDRQIIQLLMRRKQRCLPDFALLAFAVTDDGIDTHIRAVHLRCLGHADRGEDPLAERARRYVDAADLQPITVARQVRPVLVERQQLLAAQKPAQAQKRVDGWGRMSLGHDEPVTLRPVRVLIIQAHGVIEQNRERVHDQHGAADMAVAKRRDRRQRKLARLPGLCFKKFPFILHKIVPPCPPASAGQFVPR